MTKVKRAEAYLELCEDKACIYGQAGICTFRFRGEACYMDMPEQIQKARREVTINENRKAPKT